MHAESVETTFRDENPTRELTLSSPLRSALHELRLVRLEAEHQLLTDWQGEPFMGNLWRGMLGARLHGLNPAAFEALFGAGRNASHWALDAPWSDSDWAPAGCVLRSAVTLIGPACEHAQAVADALAQIGATGMGSRQSAGGARAEVGLVDLAVLGDESDEGITALKVFEKAASISDPDAPTAGVRVDLVSPLRIKDQNTVFCGLPTPEMLLRRLFGRLVQLVPKPDSHADAAVTLSGPGLFAPGEHRAWLEWAAKVQTVAHDLQAISWSRTSHRSGQAMPIEGIAGSLIWDAAGLQLLPWMNLAEWLHVGSKPSFGLGAIQARAWN